MTNTKSRIISVFLILALVLTVNTVPAFAASKSKLNLSAKATGQHTVALKWNKVSKAYNGYAIFRNGEVIKYSNSKTLKFTDSKLKAGTKYTYQVKTYKVKKVKKWYNKKTKKWQTKKPAKKYRGKSKKVVSYSYKTKSKVITVRTDSKPVDPSSPSNNPSDPLESTTKEYTITWKNYNGNTLKTDKVKAGDKPKYTGSTPTKPETDKYTYEFDGWNPSLVAASENTSYTAKFKALEKTSSYTYKLHLFNEPYGNGGKTVIYLETNNPNKFDYSLGVLNSNNQTKAINIEQGFYKNSSNNTYDDIDTSKINGYICICSPECVGNCTFVVYEYNYNSDTDVIVKTRSVYIRDYYAEKTAWQKSILNEVTNSSMTNSERMYAICNYYNNNFKYSRENGQGQYITLIADVGIPYWIDKRTNSAENPGQLVEFGTLIGYSLQNMYPVYDVGTPEWRQYHMCAYSAEDNIYYSANIPVSSGYMDPNSIVMFNPNTYQFWGE